MKSKQLWPLAVAVLLAASTSGVVQAAPTAAERETARRLMDEGKTRIKSNELGRAIEAFHKAHEIMHVPTTGMALAKAHLAAGHLVEARDVALEVGRLPREAGEPAVFESARKSARDLDAQLKLRIPTVRVKLKGGSASRVAVDDVEIAPALVGEPIAVNPGKRVVSARSSEGGEAKDEIELAEREHKELELTLPARGETPKPVTKPAATTPSSTASSASPPPPPKLHGFGNDDVDPHPGDRTTLAEGLMYGGFGVGVVGVAIGAVTGAMTLSKASDVEPQCANNICARTAKDDLDSAHTLSTVSTIAFAVGGAGILTGAIGLLLPRRSSVTPTRGGLGWEWIASASSSRSRVTLFPAPSGLGGRF